MNTEQHPPLRIIGRQLNGQLVDVSVREGSNYFQFTDYFGKKLIDLIVVSRKNEPLEAGVFLNSDDPIQEWPLAEVLEFIEVRTPQDGARVVNTSQQPELPVLSEPYGSFKLSHPLVDVTIRATKFARQIDTSLVWEPLKEVRLILESLPPGGVKSA